jgi:hypothetical protein
MNRRSFLSTATLATGAALATPLSAFAAVRIVDPIGIHFSQGQFRKWNPDKMDYDYTGPLVQYRLLCYYRSDGLAVAFPSPVSVPLTKAKADAQAQMLAFPTPQPDTRCGYNQAWPMTEAEFRLWVQELKASVGGWS